MAMSSDFVPVRLEKLEGEGQEWGEESGVPRVQIVIRHLLSGVIQVQRDVQVETPSGHAGLKAAERDKCPALGSWDRQPVWCLKAQM